MRWQAPATHVADGGLQASRLISYGCVKYTKPAVPWPASTLFWRRAFSLQLSTFHVEQSHVLDRFGQKGGPLGAGDEHLGRGGIQPLQNPPLMVLVPFRGEDVQRHARPVAAHVGVVFCLGEQGGQRRELGLAS